MARDEWPFAFAPFAFALGKLGRPFAFAPFAFALGKLGKREARRYTPLPPFNRNPQRLETKDVKGFDTY